MQGEQEILKQSSSLPRSPACSAFSQRPLPQSCRCGGGAEGPEGDRRLKFPLPLPPFLQPAILKLTFAHPSLLLPGLTSLCLGDRRPPRVQSHASHQVCRGGRWVRTLRVCCGCRVGHAVTRGMHLHFHLHPWELE